MELLEMLEKNEKGELKTCESNAILIMNYVIENE